MEDWAYMGSLENMLNARKSRVEALAKNPRVMEAMKKIKADPAAILVGDDKLAFEAFEEAQRNYIAFAKVKASRSPLFGAATGLRPDRATAVGVESYLQRALAMDPPSRTSLKREQLDPSGPLINSWRPRMDTAGGRLPPELADRVFAEAVDSMARAMEVDQATIETAGEMCCVCADIYDNEAGLTDAVKGLLGPYLKDDKAVAICSGFAANKVSPDWALGDLAKDPSNVFMIVEVKPGIGGSGDPHFQGANYHLHFWRQRADSVTFRNTYCPAFLLEVVGPHVRLSAVAWLDRVTIFPLTPLLNLLPAHPVTDCLLMPVARMLAALRTGVHKLAAAHMEGAALQQSAPLREMLPLPWPICMDPRYDAALAVRLSPSNFTFYVPLAGSGDGEGGDGVKAVVVRLCREYGLKPHKDWAELGLAPKVLRVEQLPGGWRLVEIEWLSEVEWWRLSELPKGELDGALSKVKEVLDLAHDQTGMVHGDMRPANCLVRRDDKVAGLWHVRFVDFEWAGREGEATYPAFLNPDIPWPEGVGYGKQLQCTHDLQLLTASTAGHAAGGAHRATGPGAVMSLPAAACHRSAAPLRKAAGVVLYQGVGMGWWQRGTAGWLRPAGSGSRLAWW